VDRVLHDGDEVKLGDTVLTAHKTAGHTRGCTTWSLKVREAGKTYDVVIVGSPNVNPGYKLVNNARYPEIADDYARGFRVLKSLPCDVFLGAHGSYYDMEAKHAKLNAGGANPYIDPEGYKSYVAEREQAFLSELQKQKAAAEKADGSQERDSARSHMNPILISILLGLTAAAANVFGGAIIVQRHWERRYLRYFVALGAGFMLATALVEMVPESLELRGKSRRFWCCWDI
jgi:hypothetical protein